MSKRKPSLEKVKAFLNDACELNAAPRKLRGGRADGRRPRDFDFKALLKGTLHELEHTSDMAVAMEIAMDHLAEDRRYYDKLDKIEGVHLKPVRIAKVQKQLGSCSRNAPKNKLRKTRATIAKATKTVTKPRDRFDPDPNIMTRPTTRSKPPLKRFSGTKDSVTKMPRHMLKRGMIVRTPDKIREDGRWVSFKSTWPEAPSRMIVDRWDWSGVSGTGRLRKPMSNESYELNVLDWPETFEVIGAVVQ